MTAVYGGIVKNPDGSYQVDGVNPNFGLVSKTNTTFSNIAFGASDCRSAHLTFSALMPIVVVKSPSRITLTGAVLTGSSSWQMFVFSKQAAAGDALTWYLFDSFNNITLPSDYGIQFNDSITGSTTLYHTAIAPFVPVAKLTPAAPSYSGISGRTYAVAQMALGYEHDANYLDGLPGSGGLPHDGMSSGTAVGTASTSYGGALVDGVNVSADMDTYEGYPLFDHTESSYGSGQWEFLVLDVTGL